MDRFEAISTFAAVAEQGGFSAASRQLGVPLATVSRRVAELEQSLGARLLTRSTRKVTLTEIGEQYLNVCKRVLDELGEADRLAAGEYQAPRGDLVVSAPRGLGSVYLGPIVTDFLTAYPEINVDLRLSDSLVNLSAEGVDVALRIAHLADSSLIAVKLGVIRHVVCASPAYLDRRSPPQTIDDLSNHDCVTFTGLSPAREWTFRRKGRTARVPVKSRLSVTTADAALGAAVAGIGLTRLLCYQASKAIEAKQLSLLLRAYEPEPLPVSLIYPSGRLVPKKLKAFLDFVVPRMKQKLVFDP
jgi:DNA-binding transcriptional LysR family regulator